MSGLGRGPRNRPDRPAGGPWTSSTSPGGHNAATQLLVAVPYSWWTTANPNNDPLCQGISVKVSYGGKTLTVPVRDKCPSCDSTHIDLSRPAFARFAPLGQGVINGITWQLVKTGLAGQTLPVSEPVTGSVLGH